MPRSPDRAFTVLLLAFIVVFGFFPWANWIPGGHEAEWYGLVAADWLNGSAIVVGGAVVLTVLARRLPLWRAGAARPVLDRYELHPGRWILGIALVSGPLYAIVHSCSEPTRTDRSIC